MLTQSSTNSLLMSIEVVSRALPFQILYGRGTWVAQSVKPLTLAQVMISWSVSLSPELGSVLTAQSLEPASDTVSPYLSAPPLFTLCLCLSLSLFQK